jgi:hypothetical protein
MNAKKFIEDRFDTDWTIQISASDLEYVLINFAEAYHKAKVEEISDKMIDDDSFTYGYCLDSPQNAYKQGQVDFKKQLLKQ